ncbi:TetR family transcriptional regulator C-terminal domain-containing protein [Mycolicibacterium vaccae]|uniref:BetI-type transcriptional repressor C-terminal domain-containing protein n=1 Tax=Mycolicibacterium vaccae ATCC 25954 TaxID=1194972 RepID=K0V6F0_MYCVA|nr:TetR family transcriptional regulator C-terminal domain-containing protein [Mycolicibacterium vaccae]EJZ06614.1 hypothetical protein MVAC_21453 [Mycolicibacterium vaccae ATCC 25954]MCV7063561.1 TetR family transcriptional regulator C-terminal domain-containing protein [Mycolicibacterium vaccae]
MTGTTSELASIYQAWLADVRDAVASALRQGQSDGSVKPDLDAHHAAQAAVDATTGLVFRWCLSPDQVDLEVELRASAASARQLLGA